MIFKLYLYIMIYLTNSKEVCLLHYPNEVFLANLPVAVAIGLVDHLLEFIVSHGFAQFSGHSLQVPQRDLPRVVVVEEPEGFEHLFTRVSFGLREQGGVPS